MLLGSFDVLLQPLEPAQLVLHRALVQRNADMLRKNRHFAYEVRHVPVLLFVGGRVRVLRCESLMPPYRANHVHANMSKFHERRRCELWCRGHLAEYDQMM